MLNLPSKAPEILETNIQQDLLFMKILHHI
jgi:hypothetical protein